MRNIRLVLEYEGTYYQGWQKQQNTPHTIQAILENTLEGVVGHSVKIIGAGRTDRGVHAKNQVANFFTTSRLNPYNIEKALNVRLPQDIKVKKAEDVDLEFHARFWAKAKTYKYFIINSRTENVFWKRFSWHIPYRLDLELIRKESFSLLGRNDFRSFCASGLSGDTLRTLYRIEIRKKGEIVSIEIKADGFLYKMARNIVGTLVDIGRGKINLPLKKILESRERRFAGRCAPPQGLFLWKVEY